MWTHWRHVKFVTLLCCLVCCHWIQADLSNTLLRRLAWTHWQHHINWLFCCTVSSGSTENMVYLSKTLMWHLVYTHRQHSIKLKLLVDHVSWLVRTPTENIIPSTTLCYLVSSRGCSSVKSTGPVIERSRVRSQAGAAGKCSSPELAFCGDSYFGGRSTAVLSHVKTLVHSAKSVGGK